MGNYDDHLQYGYAAYSLLVGLLVFAVAAETLTIGTAAALAGLAFPLTLLGAVFPDIDHHASKPHRALRRLTFGLTTTAAFYVVYTRGTWLDETLPAIGPMTADAVFAMTTLCVALLSGTTARFLVGHFRPPHRGITHRVPTGLAVATLIGLVIWQLAPYAISTQTHLFAVGSGGSFFAGFLSHLQCDKMLRPAATNIVRRVLPKRS